MLLDRLFGNKGEREKNILKCLGADMHSHLIPGVDDGAKDYETAFSCIAEMKRYGINKIYLTPHFQAHRYTNDEEDIKERFEKLKQKVAEQDLGVELALAGEYLIDDGFRKRLEEPKFLTIDGKYLLVEFSFNQSMMGMEELFFDMQMKGYEIILAHPERYIYLSESSSLLNNLKEQGVYFQANILSFAGFYGKEVKQRAYTYIEKGWIDFIGSDIHNEKYRKALVEFFEKSSNFRKILNKNTFLNNQL
jgi:tyrosine-protein phosphatase YwqE